MSDERMQELGLPRRAFLKRAAVGAFAAPLIVSFGFAGTAEAAAACLPNQSFSNQTHSLFNELTNTLWSIWAAENLDGLIETPFARNIRHLYSAAVENVLNDQPKGFCHNLSHLKYEIGRQSGRKIDADYAAELIGQINSLKATYCECAG